MACLLFLLLEGVRHLRNAAGVFSAIGIRDCYGAQCLFIDKTALCHILMYCYVEFSLMDFIREVWKAVCSVMT